MSKPDIYESVTTTIIEQLEKGVAPWACPWNAAAPVGGLPANASTGRAYSGVNILLLWLAQAERGFSCHDWLTYKQAEAMGAQVRKGEKATRIVYADSFIPKAERAKARTENREPSSVYFLKGFCVFNRDQIDGLEPPAPTGPLPDREAIAVGENLILRSGADFRIGGNEAYYVSAADFIRMPDQRQFRNQIDYYRTAAHELSHWTGHQSRLDRKLANRFGSAQYAREELIAEMGAAFVLASIGITPTVRHADYIGAWLKVLREDSKAIVRAASAASKAADYLLSKI